MQSPEHRLPIGFPDLAGVRLGCHRHYPAVSPFMRAHLALRRMAIAEADLRSQKQSEALTLALLDDLRRAAHVRSFA